jgi:hypothetical protein
MFDGTSNFGL